MSTSRILESFRRFLRSLGIRPVAVGAVAAGTTPPASVIAKPSTATTPATMSATTHPVVSSPAPLVVPVAAPVAPVSIAKSSAMPIAAVAQPAAVRQPAALQPAVPGPSISQAVVAQVAAAQAPVKPMRSLEEVRADLARMRQSARLRHARLVAEHHTNFAPTDFMEMPGLLSVQREPEPSFAATAYLDFGTLTSHSAR
jgi:hypothetical protein